MEFVIERRVIACMAGVCVIVLAGCTTVIVDGGSPSTERRFGVLRIEAAGDGRALVLRTMGAGIVPTTAGLSVGYVRETAAIVYAPEDCRVLLFLDKESEAAAFLAGFQEGDLTPEGVCVVNPKEDR